MKKAPPNSVVLSKHVHLTLRGIDKCRKASPSRRFAAATMAVLAVFAVLAVAAAIYFLRRG